MSLLEEWRDGRYFHIFGSRDELMTRGGDRLVLQPSKGKNRSMTIAASDIRDAVETLDGQVANPYRAAGRPGGLTDALAADIFLKLEKRDNGQGPLKTDARS